jgi:hypothetical protein
MVPIPLVSRRVGRGIHRSSPMCVGGEHYSMACTVRKEAVFTFGAGVNRAAVSAIAELCRRPTVKTRTKPRFKEALLNNCHAKVLVDAK